MQSRPFGRYRVAGSPLRFDPAYGLDTRLGDDQTIEDVDDYHLELTATVLHTAQLEWWLQSFASEVEVLEPPELREAMAEQAEWLMRNYRGKPG